MLEIATFAAAVTYAGITYRMWREMQKTNINTLQAFRTDERAWVWIEPIRPVLIVPRSGKFGNGFRYEIYPKNIGKTVARNVVVKAESSQSSIELNTHADWITNIQDKYLLDQYKESGTDKVIVVPANPVPKVLAPNATATVPFTLTGSEPQIFPKSEWVSYLIGRIDYIDEFGVPHWVKFCYFVAKPNGDLWNCQEGNDADRNPENR